MIPMEKPAPKRLHVWGNESEGGKLVLSLIEKRTGSDVYIRTVGNGSQEGQLSKQPKKAAPKLKQGELDGLFPEKSAIEAIRR